MATKIHMMGARGRMGQAIIRLAGNSSDYEIVGQADQGDDLFAGIADADAVIDFSHHSIGVEVAEKTAELGKALVIGTTGHSDEDRAQVLSVGEKIPMILASNYSVGVNTLFYATRKVAEILGEDFDQEIVEMHHRHKKDAPSGTARTLGEILADVMGGTYDELVTDGRTGEPGARPTREIGMHALRGGEVVGDHTVVFAGAGERLELTHKAASRDTFGGGALRAAAWLAGKPAGCYSMFEILGLE